MVKNGMFKKVAALTATVTMVGSFAVAVGAEETTGTATATAPQVTTTTTYTAGSNNAKVTVTANVANVENGAQVTYYATKGSDIVYVDQTEAGTNGAAAFEYVTAATNLMSNVKVGYTGATAAVDDKVNGYTITLGSTVQTVPTEKNGGTYTFPYTMPEGKQLKDVTAKAGESDTVVEVVTSSEYNNGSLTVVLNGLYCDITLTVETEEKIVLNPSGEYVKGAAVISNGKTDEYTSQEPTNVDVVSSVGDRKLTVIGKVVDSKDYGILISETAITLGDFDDLNSYALGTNRFASKGKDDNGYFAIQLIDTTTVDDTNSHIVKADTDYYTAVYYKNENTEKYVIVLGGSPVKAVSTAAEAAQ